MKHILYPFVLLAICILSACNNISKQSTTAEADSVQVAVDTKAQLKLERAEKF